MMGKETRTRLAALGEEIDCTDWHSRAFAAREEMVEHVGLATTTEHGSAAWMLADHWLHARQSVDRFALYLLLWLLLPEDPFTLSGALREPD